MKHLKLLQNSHKIPSNPPAEPHNSGQNIKRSGLPMDFGSGNRSKEPFGSSIALGMIEKLSAIQKSTHEQSEIPVVLPVESGESIIKLEPNLTTFENENNKNGASCPICGKTFSQE